MVYGCVQEVPERGDTGMSITQETNARAIKCIGKYLADHADELCLIECSDLTGNDIWIHLKRREGKDENRSD